MTIERASAGKCLFLKGTVMPKHLHVCCAFDWASLKWRVARYADKVNVYSQTMDACTKSGSFRSWYGELKSFNAKSQRGSFLPHLGLGTGLVTVFVGSFFAAHLADALAIIIAYGPHAYFRDGLRIYDWKHGILSDGSHISFVGSLVQVPATLALWVVLILATDFCSMLVNQIVHKNGRWLKTSLCFFGGVALLLFAGSLYREGAWGAHPIPLSALIGGMVLIWKSFVLLFRRSAKSDRP